VSLSCTLARCPGRIAVRWLAMDHLLLLIALSFSPALPASQNQEAQQHANRGFQLAQNGDLKGAENELRRAVDLAPNEPQFLSGLGGLLGTQQKLEEAQIYFEKALKLEPQNLMFRRNLAANQWQLGQLDPAKQNLERILKLKPRDEPTILLLGMVMENLQDYTRAAALLGSVPVLVKQRPESLTALARAYFRTNQREKARATLEILQHHSAGASGVFMGGRVAAEVGDYETAERLFESIRSSYSDTPTLGYNLALVQYRSGRLRESQETLEGLIAAGHLNSDIYNLLGWCYQKQDRRREARQALEHAIQLDSSKESNYLDLAMILAGNRQLAAALAVSRDNVERHPNSYHAHVMKGLIELRMDQFTDAVRSYGRAEELDPSNPEAHRGLAVAQFAAGMMAEAKSTFEGALQKFSGDGLQYQEYGKMLLKLGETGDAEAESRGIELLNTALKLDHSLAEPHYYLGNLALKRGKANEAVRHLEEAVRLDPKSSRISYALARAYRRLGRAGDADRQLQHYQELKAGEESAASFLDFIKDK
jgi:Flp pilus assembly protein TadD